MQGFRVPLKLAGAGAALLVLSALAALPSAARADDQGAVSFSHKDWELRCDNTRTCRAAGYHSETGNSDPVSLLLIRAAGPNAPVKMSLQVSAEKPYKPPLRIVVGKASASGLMGDIAELTSVQVRALLPELLRGADAKVSAADADWTLSLEGLNAVLLKMDEAQGRLGTPGALVRRGEKAESSVLAPLPAPVVNNVVPPRARALDTGLAAKIVPTINLAEAKEQCNGGEKLETKSFELNRLSADRVLLLLPCGMGAYNYSQLAWIASDKPPYGARMIEANGEFDPADGSLQMVMKGRGIGDCLAMQSWHFNGKEFVQSSQAGDGMCRGFAGGAWSLPSYVSQIRSPVKSQQAQPANQAPAGQKKP